MVTASSLRYLGWIWSGPGDLSIFSLLISLVTFVSVIINGGILCSISLGGINGISPSGSFVKTWQKKFAKWARSPMPLLVFDLEFMYCQIAFGFFLAFLARSLSNAFFGLLVRLLAWFLTLLYWCFKFSYSFLSVDPLFAITFLHNLCLRFILSRVFLSSGFFPFFFLFLLLLVGINFPLFPLFLSEKFSTCLRHYCFCKVDPPN